MLNTIESKVKLDEGMDSVRSTFNQIELLCRELRSQNEILWEVILDCGNEVLWEKLFFALTDYYKEEKIGFTINQIEILLLNGKYSLALIGFNHLLKAGNGKELSESIQCSLTHILDLMFSMDIPDLDEMDRMFIEILSWMRRAAQSEWRESVHEFFHQNHAKLNQLTADTNSPEIILAYLHTLLTYDFYYPLRDMLEYLLDKEWPFLDAKIDEEQFTRFLWMAFYLSMDDVLLGATKKSGRFLEQVQNPEIRLYQSYYASKNREYNRQTSNELLTLMSQSQMFEDNEKAKLWEEIVRFLQIETKIAATVELPKDIKKASNIWQIKNKTDNCPHCSQSKLVKQQFMVEGFNKKSEQVPKQVVFELLSCNKCLRVYSYGNMIYKLNRALEPYRCKVNLDPIDYLPKSAVTKPNAPKSKVEKLTVTSTTNGHFAWPSTEANESDRQSDREGNFREETDLHRLGYRITGLSRMQRWDVLVRKVIPKIALKEIVYTIARNVRLRKSQVGGKTKFAYAIAEWEHDLKRLKQEYYKSSFTWPQY
ncbi:hypothetical protein [Paenibacillus sp. Soil724D2]|uniref:hypothetical protein n=1 Tax=Paenibacillus sp. (strain Soil724D2) TaxID=1736392 RepID=UPI0007150DC3|nr:hypothetical protein [Paenibacillus sp. Soil724D2]KRE50666.1 hypothetical protein ASG85_20670 [Paenibacillus sp. Soil724D2]